LIVKKNKFYLIQGLIIILFLTFFLFFYHSDYYYGDGIGFIVADSKYYFELSQRSEGIDGVFRFTAINKNLFGPLFFYDFLLQESRFLFFTITFSIFLYLIFQTYKNSADYKLKNYLLFFLVINPVLLSSFTGPNKEIVSFLSVLAFLNFVLKAKFKYLVLALVLALFARFELFFLILFLSFFVKKHFLPRWFIVLGIIFLISITIKFTGISHMDKVLDNQREGSIGLTILLSQLSQQGLYFLIVLPKILMNMFGGLIISPFKLEGYSILLYISQILFLFLSLKSIIKKRISLKNDFFFVFLVSAIVFSVPDFLQHRYFFPFYPMLVFMVFLPKRIDSYA
jgi:hypothetical protein